MGFVFLDIFGLIPALPMDRLIEFFEFQIQIGKISFPVKSIFILVFVFLLTRFLLRLLRKLVVKGLSNEKRIKFQSVFTFFNYFIYLVVILITFDTIGVEITTIFAASAALLVGVGLALQTFIQDIISGIFIIADQAVHVGDIIEVEGKVGRVEDITLRTTRAITIDNKVLVIPNHKFMTTILYNWTENGTLTREQIDIGVEYNCDPKIVKQLLIDIALKHPRILKKPEPTVLLSDFGENALMMTLLFTLNNSFYANAVKSDLRYAVFEALKENDISIPFPQRTVWLKQTPSKT